MRPRRKVILLIESSRAAGRELLRGIAAYARHHGPWSFFWKASGFEKVSTGLSDVEADGVISRDVELTRELLRRGLPTVIVGHRGGELEGMANVVTDSEAIGRMAADHLLSCGFTNFAFCGYLDCSWSDLRYKSFSRRIRHAGKDANFLGVRSEERGFSSKQERPHIIRWLLTLRRPVGLMACNDDLGQEVIESCKLAGLSVPADLAVIGTDNDELVCGLSDPPLSSVALNFERAGYESAKVLDRLMHGARKGSRRIVVRATHVVPRRSTDVVAVDDSAVAKALSFIRDNSSGAMSVPVVARAAGVSRRALEQRFRNLLGHSILDEIRRVRIDQIARLLVETELPVAQIASALGFGNLQHIARYFRKGHEVSPLAYRKAFGPKHSGI